MKKLSTLMIAFILLALAGCRKENAMAIKELDLLKNAIIIANIEHSRYIKKKGSEEPEMLHADETHSDLHQK